MCLDEKPSGLQALEPGSYTLLDLRSEQETAYGTIPGSVPANAAALPEGLPAEPGRIVLFCTRGKLSLETAERLRDEGFDACSLKGGYLAWLMRQMQRQEAEELCSRVENSLRKRFRLKLWCNLTKAIRQYELVKPNDRIAVCMSGGKDSMLMAKLFQELQRYTKFPFLVEYLVMDPGYSPENRRVIEENARKLNIPIHIFESNIFDYVYNVDKSPCYLCARMRRGHLYDYARQLGCNKIALGHHYDDVIETILMGMLYGAQVQTMMPKLHSTNFPRFEIVPNTTIFTGGNTQWIKQSSRPPLRSAQVSAWVWALSARQSAKVMPSVRLSRAWHVSRRSPIRCVPT